MLHVVPDIRESGKSYGQLSSLGIKALIIPCNFTFDNTIAGHCIANINVDIILTLFTRNVNSIRLSSYILLSPAIGNIYVRDAYHECVAFIRPPQSPLNCV